MSFKLRPDIDAYIMMTDPLNLLQDASRTTPGLGLYPANGRRHYLKPTDLGSFKDGHSIDSVLKSYGISPEDFKIKK